jgi:N-acetylglutamate synthase-like GNAT family acetyltransferase
MSKIRRMRESDLHDVEEISRHIWEGNDYVPMVFDEWLKDAKSRFFGVETDGRIVAVGNLRLIENKRTGWMEGLRVHPEYRGRGFANEITQHLVREAERLGLQRLRYTTSDENIASLKLAKEAGFSELMKMAVFWVTNATTMPQTQAYLQIEEADSAKTFRLLRTDPDIVPHGVLIFDWKALNASSQNLDEIEKDHRFCVAVKDQKLDSMSIYTCKTEPESPWCSFTIYANGVLGFAAHLSHDMKIAMEGGFESISYTFETKYEEASKSLNFECEEQGMTHLVLLEKNMRIHKTSRSHH